MQDVPTKCQCGKVTGLLRGVSPSASNHVICPCKGCQAYAHFLGRADDMLDEQGYSNIFQMNPKAVEIHSGWEHVAAVKVTAGGPIRWYTTCCKTPLGNTLPRGGIPFIGILPIVTGVKGTAPEVVKLVGPVRAKVNDAERSTFHEKLKTFFMLVRLFAKMMAWRIKDGSYAEPFFNSETMKPVRKPEVLSDAERAALYEQVI